jgi:hypothetical protein
MRLGTMLLGVGAALLLEAAATTPTAFAHHAVTPPPPELTFVGVETQYCTTCTEEGVIQGHWFVFDVTSHGGADWVTGHSGNWFKLWRREDSQGDTEFKTIWSSARKQQSVRIRAYVGPGEFEWTSTFYVTEVGGVGDAQDTGPSLPRTVETPMPPVLLELHHPIFPCCGFVTASGATRPLSSLPTLLAEETGPTIGMLIYGYNFAYPEDFQSAGETPPADYPRPRIRWNGELGLVSGERKFEFGNAIRFDIPRELLVGTPDDDTATIEIVQGTAEVASEPYVLTLAPAPPGPRNVVAVREQKKKKATTRVTWQAPQGAPPVEYRIERAVMADESDAKAAKAGELDVFELVGRVSGDVEKFIDKHADPAKGYSYRILAVMEGGEAAVKSAVDLAYPAGRIPKAEIHPWGGSGMEFDVGGITHELFHNPADQRDGWGALWTLKDQIVDTYVVLGPAKKPDARKLVLGAVLEQLGDAASPTTPSWTHSLTEGAKGAFKATLYDGGPFDLETYRKAEGSLSFPSKQPGEMPVVVPFTARKTCDGACGDETLLDATIGASRDKVKPGQRFVVLFFCAALGPNPLYAGRAGLEVSVNNGGVIVSVQDFNGYAAVDPEGRSTMRFRLGALGLNKKGAPEGALLGLLVEAPADTTARQMTVTCRLTDDAGAPFEHEQALAFRHERRYVDVEIQQPPPVVATVRAPAPEEDDDYQR